MSIYDTVRLLALSYHPSIKSEVTGTARWVYFGGWPANKYYDDKGVEWQYRAMSVESEFVVKFTGPLGSIEKLWDELKEKDLVAVPPILSNVPVNWTDDTFELNAEFSISFTEKRDEPTYRYSNQPMVQI